MKQFLTHSRMASFRACARRHYLRYELGLSPVEKPSYMNVGTAFHSAVDAKEKDIDLELGEMNSYDAALAAAMFTVHEEYHPPLNIIASELQFELPLIHLRTKRHSRVWKWAGVIDGIAWLNDGRMALIERKTTSRDITPGGDYWTTVMRDQQISQYMEAARKLGWPLTTVIYDVVRRPLHRPRFATPAEKRKYKKDGTLYANQRETDETPEEYASRIADLMRTDPEKHFQRIEIPRLQKELDASAEDQWMVQRQIRHAQRNNEWPRNPSSCLIPFRCQFLDICDHTDLDTFTPEGFKRLENLHPELST